MGQGLLSIEALRSHSVGLLSTTQRSVPDNTQPSHKTDIHTPAGFEPAIPASERSQTHALDRAANGTGAIICVCVCVCVCVCLCVELRFPCKRRLGATDLVWKFRDWNPARPVRSLVVIPTTFSRLLKNLT